MTNEGFRIIRKTSTLTVLSMSYKHDLLQLKEVVFTRLTIQPMCDE